eukprot:TRINITY_DN3422_c0_g1_i4.p1 TRINITY_DN3422_c0_g1~~TRINITY_DN3422_c0_g1_i4.p1  ORF type:complete len:304 (+),score=56.67 TRINITY_DN3422_c0_g1_i4:51-914(+)
MAVETSCAAHSSLIDGNRLVPLSPYVKSFEQISEFSCRYPSLNACVNKSRLVTKAAIKQIPSFGFHHPLQASPTRKGLLPATSIRINRKKQNDVKDVSIGVGPEAEDDDEDLLELCPVDCVREVRSKSELQRVLNYAEDTDSLVVIDFYRTACGSCRYIANGFTKLCRGEGEAQHRVIFLKHNVMDEYEEELTELAEDMRIRAVPLFHFYRHGQLLESFATRDRQRLLAAVDKYAPHDEDLPPPSAFFDMEEDEGLSHGELSRGDDACAETPIDVILNSATLRGNDV